MRLLDQGRGFGLRGGPELVERSVQRMTEGVQ